MPFESSFNKDEKSIYFHYWGNVTIAEYVESFEGEVEFLDGMTGLVGIIVDASDLRNIAPSVLAHAVKMKLSRYKPLAVALVKPSALIGTMAQIFSKLAPIAIRNFDTYAQAEAFIKAQQASSAPVKR